MRLLHLDSGPEMRGGQYQVLYLARGLSGGSHECLLLARGRLLESARAEGLSAAPLTWSAVRKLRRSFDLVHAHDARSHTMAAVCGAGPLIVSRRVAFRPGTGPVSRWKYCRPLRFLAVSQHVRRRLVESGIPEECIRVVYDGVPELRPGPVTGRILAPASDDPRKGSEIVRESGLVVEFSSDLRRDLPGARLFLYLTHEEGLGSAILLAMSAGVPVVASRTGGIVELIEHEVTGLLCENAAASVAGAARRILADEGLGRRLAANAGARYADAFTADHMVRNTLTAYEECLACRKS